jgi:hypothetical protein
MSFFTSHFKAIINQFYKIGLGIRKNAGCIISRGFSFHFSVMIKILFSIKKDSTAFYLSGCPILLSEIINILTSNTYQYEKTYELISRAVIIYL